jgi:hypothetical protein
VRFAFLIEGDSEDMGLEGATVIGGDGRKLGTVEAVYSDNASGSAAWAAVRSGMFGGSVALVPLAAATYSGDELRVPFDKEQLRTAPHHDPGRELSRWDEADLFRHYGMAPPATDDAVTRSEEQLRVGIQTREVGRVRVRKHVVTEHQQVVVPVVREELRIEREPVDDADPSATTALRSPTTSTRSRCTPSGPS